MQYEITSRTNDNIIMFLNYETNNNTTSNFE